MNIVDSIRTEMGANWLPLIYGEKIRAERTRSYLLDVPIRLNSAEIQYTLLGIELRVGKRRFACPDLSTARYIRVFARFGVRNFAIPYDISKVPAYADMLESAWQLTLLQCAEETKGQAESSRFRSRSLLFRELRREIALIGAGEAMPKFDTKATRRD